MEADPISIVSAFFMHVGARHIQLELTDAQRQLMSHPVTKYVILFAMFYVSTRSVLWSVVLLGAYFLMIYMLLNEKHPMNVLSRRWLQSRGFLTMEKEEASAIEMYRSNLAKLA